MISPAAVEQLRKAGVTDAEIDALRRTGSITIIGADGEQTNVSVGEGGRVVMSKTTTTASMTTTTSTVSGSGVSGSGNPIGVDNAAAVHIAETALGQDLDGDGIIGRPAQPQGTGSPATVSSPLSASTASPLSAPASSPLVPDPIVEGSGGPVRPAAFVVTVIAGLLLGASLVLTFWGGKQLAAVGNCGESNYYELAVEPCPSWAVESTLAGVFGTFIFGLMVLIKPSHRLIKFAAVVAGLVLGSTVMWNALPEPAQKGASLRRNVELIRT